MITDLHIVQVVPEVIHFGGAGFGGGMPGGFGGGRARQRPEPDVVSMPLPVSLEDLYKRCY